MSSSAKALLLLEQEDRISHREYLLISQFISRKDFSLENLEKIISNKTKKLAELQNDLKQLIHFDGVEISVINRLLRLDNRTQKQDDLLKDYPIQDILNRVDKFRQVITELIDEDQTDLTNLIKIRDVYVDYLPEAINSPRSFRSELETSPTRQFNITPTLSPRENSSPTLTPRESLRNSGHRLLMKSPHRKLMRKSKSFNK